MRGSFASLPSLQCSSKHCHTRSLPTLDFLFFVSLYKQQTGYLVNPGHLDIYSGAPVFISHCLMCWSVQQPCPFPPALAHKSSCCRVWQVLWHTGSNTKSNCDTQHQIQNQIDHQSTAALRGLHCSADVHCMWYKRYTTMSGVLRFKKENNPVSLWWVLVSGQKWLTAKYSQYSCL